MNTTRKPSTDLSKAHMIFHRDGLDAEHTIHYEAPRARSFWGHAPATTLCGEATGAVYGVPTGIKIGHRGEVNCVACLEALEDEGSDL